MDVLYDYVADDMKCLLLEFLLLVDHWAFSIWNLEQIKKDFKIFDFIVVSLSKNDNFLLKTCLLHVL